MDKLPKDILVKIALELDSLDILSYCRHDTRFNNAVCKNNIFWMKKFYQDFGRMDKPVNLNWFYFYDKVNTTEPNDLLWEGIKSNEISIIHAALTRGADINRVPTPLDLDEKTPLRWASGNSHLKTIKYLVDNGADINAPMDEALENASGRGRLEVVKYLLENGADIHAGDPLDEASLNGHLDVVKYLVENGADNSVQALSNAYYGIRLLEFKPYSEALERSYIKYSELIEYLKSLP